MKTQYKKLFSIAAMTALVTTSASADILRVEGAVGAWQTTPTGTISYQENNSFDLVDQSGFEASTNVYAWIYLKHPIPVVPNVRIEYAEPSFEGDIKQKIEWDGDVYASGTNSLSLTQYDAVLYYNILDNTLWSTIDLGLDVKYIDGNYKLSESTGLLDKVDQNFAITMPLAYVRGRVQIPITNIGVEAIVRGISYSDNTVVDAEIKLDYTMDFVPVIQPGLELGYRYQQIKLDSSSIGLDANLDTTFSGIYGGIMVRF